MNSGKELISQGKHPEVEFHRAYRKLHHGNLTGGILVHLLLFIVIAFPVVFWLDKLTYLYSSLASLMVSKTLPDLNLVSMSFLTGNIWILNGQGHLPSGMLLLVTITVSLLIWIQMLLFKEIPLPVTLAVRVLCAINIAGSFYFIFWGKQFPYDFNSFSHLFITAEIGMWLALPLMLIFALMPVPVSLIAKAGLLITTVVYVYTFGIFRYAICLYILAKCSYLWMALLYFFVVVFFDFASMIAFYSHFISLAAPRIIKKRGVWRWLYSS